MQHLSNDRKDHPNQQENSHKLCDKMGHPILSLMESQRKLRQHDQNCPMERKPLSNKCYRQKKYINPKGYDCGVARL